MDESRKIILSEVTQIQKDRQWLVSLLGSYSFKSSDVSPQPGVAVVTRKVKGDHHGVGVGNREGSNMEQVI